MRDAFEREMEQNRKAYEALRDKIRAKYAGQYVAMAFGRVVHVSPSFDESRDAVEALQPAPEHIAVFPADEDPLFDVIESRYGEFVD
jgi:hypothetical protein